MGKLIFKANSISEECLMTQAEVVSNVEGVLIFLKDAERIGMLEEMRSLISDINSYIRKIEELTGWEYRVEGFTKRMNYHYDMEKKDIVYDTCVVKTLREIITSETTMKLLSEVDKDMASSYKYLLEYVEATKSIKVKKEEENFINNNKQLLDYLDTLIKEQDEICQKAQEYRTENNIEEDKNYNQYMKQMLLKQLSKGTETFEEVEKQAAIFMDNYGNLGLMTLISYLNIISDSEDSVNAYTEIMRDALTDEESLRIRAEILQWASLYTKKGMLVLELFKNEFGEDVLGNTILERILESDEEKNNKK